MSRSKWKGPYLNKVLPQVSDSKNTIRGVSRSSTILPAFIGKIFEIHSGKSYSLIKVTTSMIGHKFGEFVLTRKSHKYNK